MKEILLGRFREEALVEKLNSYPVSFLDTDPAPDGYQP